jgi:NADPH:quinone reductase-like Zn-dependent oxidoreductase
VRLKAASLNYRDLLVVEGRYDPRLRLPLIPCSDGAAEVVALGPGAQTVAVGDRVMPLFAPQWLAGQPTREALRATLGGPLDGTLAQYLVLPEQSVVRIPDYLTDREAATLPCAALTAWTALVVEGRVTAGDTVLVQGSGGVSLFALQIARMLGARVIATSSSDAKLERLRELGAEAGINYRTVPQWGRRARELAGGDGVDHVIDVGGAQTLAESLRAVRIGGQISLIGVLSGRTAPLNLAPIFMRYVRIQGVLVGHRESFLQLTAAMAEHQLRPVLDRSFVLDQAGEALTYLESGAHFGKVTIDIP